MKLSVADENWDSTAYTKFSSSGHQEGDEHPKNLSEVTLVHRFHLPDIVQGLSVSGPSHGEACVCVLEISEQIEAGKML